MNEIFFDFVIKSMKSANENIQKKALKVLINFYSFPGCDLTLDLDEIIDIIQSQKSDLSKIAYEVLIAMSHNPNCTDFLMENRIFSFVKESLNGLFYTKQKCAVILNNLIKNIDKEHYLVLAEKYHIITLIISFLSIDDEEIDEMMISSLYNLMTSQGFVPANHEKLLSLFEEAGANEVLEQKEVESEKALQLLSELHKYLYPES